MLGAPQGLHAFLRAYYHVKSADWPANRPYPLAAWAASELGKLPTYYVMQRDRGMAATVAPEAPSASQIAACAWLTEPEMVVYAESFAHTGFQGGLQWYRCQMVPSFIAEMQTWSGRTIDQPSLFIAGASDWGVHQSPGVFGRMQSHACTRMLGAHLVPGAGHWVQQEQPRAVIALIANFLAAA